MIASSLNCAAISLATIYAPPLVKPAAYEGARRSHYTQALTDERVGSWWMVACQTCEHLVQSRFFCQNCGGSFNLTSCLAVSLRREPL